MKRFSKSQLGVTLLEIMLVLAIAAMVIVMSVRYYQSATASQQTNATLQLVQAITAAADGLAQATSSYTAVNTAAVAPLLPGGGTTITSQWGGLVTVTGGTASAYNVTIEAVPVQVCPLLVSRLSSNKNFTLTAPTSAAGCSGTMNVSYTYTANP